MNVTSVFTKTLEAYSKGYRYIIEKGGSRSGKTFSILQLHKIISDKSNKKQVNTIVSHSLPHLEGGAIRDFDNILEASGISPDNVRTKHPYIYRLNNQIIEFVGFDRPGKALGAARDRLFINEANKMPFKICHQLIQRTKETIFIDYNPANDFWVTEEGYTTKSDSVVIHSTFKDNIQNLTKGQLDDFKNARQKAKLEDEQGRKGYWWNWWRVYGLGLDGMIEGAILTNWQYDLFNNDLPFGYGLDFGVRDPDALVKVAIDKKNKKIYWKEEIYQNSLSTDQLNTILKTRVEKNRLIIADSASPRTINDLKSKGFNIKGVKKSKIVDDIKVLMDYDILISPESYNLAKELNNWVWLDRKGEVPLDDNNHLIDAARYYTVSMLNPNTRKGQRVL